MRQIPAWLVMGTLLLARGSDAGQQAELPGLAGPEAVELPVTFDGPLPPVPPEVISRDAAGRATIRAVRLTTPLTMDGKLDAEVYQRVPALSDFVQTEPQPGAPATEITEVWVLFDRENVYVAARCWESHPERMVVNEMRRDNNNILQNENFAFILDTFYDRRNAIIFNLNPL